MMFESIMEEDTMGRALVILLGVVLGAAFLAHTVSAQNPSVEHAPKPGDSLSRINFLGEQ